MDIFDQGRGGAVVECENLIPDSECGGRALMPAPVAEDVTTLPGQWEPVGVHHGSAADYDIFTQEVGRGGLYRVATRNVSTGEFVLADCIVPKVSCVVSVGVDRVALSSAGNGITVMGLREGRWRADDSVETVPVNGVRIAARSDASFSLNTGAMTLAQGAARLTLSDAAVALLSRRLAAAYEDMVLSATATGRWIQPMVVALKLIGRSGVTVATTPPVVMTSGGWQCAGDVTVSVTSGSGGYEVTDITMTAKGYVLDLTIDEAIAESVACVEVWALPQMHVCDREADAPVRLLSRSDGYRLTTAVPGATRRFGSLDAERCRQVMAVAPAVTEAGACIARVDTAVSAGKTVTIAVAASALDDADRLSTLAEKAAARLSETAIDVERGVIDAISAGAGFSAEASRAGADTVLWGGVTLSSDIRSPMGMVTEWVETDEPWIMALEVTMADGSRRCRRWEFDGPMPLKLSPLIAYPDRRAVRWRLVTEDAGGIVREAMVSLEASPTGAPWALALDKSLSPTVMEETDLTLPVETDDAVSHYPSMILAATAADPLHPYAACMCRAGRITAISPAPGIRSAWDRSRSRFMVMGSAGIYAATAMAASGKLSVTLLDSSPVETQDAVSEHPSGVIVISGNRLLHVASSVVRVLESGLDEALLTGWHAETGLLLTVDRRGNVRARTLDDRCRVTARSWLRLPYAPKTLMTSAGRGLLMGTDAGIVELRAASQPQALTDIKLRCTMTADCIGPRRLSPARLRKLMVDATGASVKGSVTIYGYGGLNSSGTILSRFDIDGALTYPLRVTLVSSRHSVVEVTIEASVSPDFRLRAIRLLS